VVVYKYSEGINVVELRLLVSIGSSDTIHALTIGPNVLDGLVHRIIKKPRDVVLIVGHIVGVSVEALADGINPSSGCVLTPEVFGYFGNGIDSDSVQVVCFNEIFDPVLEILSYIGIVLVEVRQI